MKFNLTPILPKKPIFDTAKFEVLVTVATMEAVGAIHRDYEKTVATWRHKPKFYATRRGTIWYIGTNDTIYGYVEMGTAAHIIRPKDPRGFLHFNRFGFRPKSRVNYIDSYNGSPATRGETYTKEVHHPGTKARNFSKQIAKKREGQFAKLVRQAVRESKGGT